METRVIADITKGYPQQLAVIAEKLGAFLPAHDLTDSVVVLVGREDQAQVRSVFSADLQWVSIQGDAGSAPFVAVHTVATQIMPTIIAAGAKRIYLLSYSGTMLRLGSRAWGPDVSLQAIAFGSVVLNSLPRSGDGTSSSAPLPLDVGVADHEDWAYSQVCSLDDALKTMEKALGGAPVGLRQTNLKPAMSNHDPRFLGKGAIAGTRGMIGALVRVAEKRGRVRVAREYYGTANPLITLAAVPIDAPARENHEASVATSPAPGGSPAALGVPGQIAVPAGDAGDGAGTGPNTYRSNWMLDTLRRLDLGPFSLQRMALYEAIEDVLKQNEDGLPMRDLIDAAQEEARETLVRKYPGRAFPPWPVVRGIFARLLSQAGVFLDSERVVIPPGVAGDLACVRGLSEHWREKADGRLMLPLIKAAYDAGKPIGTLPELDRRALAGVLYNTRDKAAVRTVSIILAHLVEGKYAIETAEGMFEPAMY